jgi:hypothetical protein
MRRFAPALARSASRPHPLRAAVVGSYDSGVESAASVSDDMRLFVTAWFGGLVFFGTFLS